MTAEVAILSDDPGALPALVKAAASRLAAATSSAEVLEARDMANGAYHGAKAAGRMLKAKGAHDELLTAAYRAQADALEIEALAKIRLADEYDAAQERGEVSEHGGARNFKIPVGNVETTAADIGLTSKEVYEARQIRDAALIEPGIIHDILSGALDSGDSPTKALLRREIKAVTKEIRADEQAASREVRIQKIAEISKGNAELGTETRYPVIYADPPWRYENPPMGGANRSIENHYPTMTLEEICALPVTDLATDDAILYLWATAPKLAECMTVIEAWGFEYRTCMVWDKLKMGMGYHARNQHEILLISKRGSIPPPKSGERPASVIRVSRGKHSEKPAEFYEIIEKAYPELSKIELFNRSPRDGWAVWGNES